MRISELAGKRLRRSVAVCGLSLAISAGVAMAADAGAEPAARSFTAVADASGMYARYGIPGFLVVENFVDGGGPVAQSVLGSDGTAQSFASLPYPGSTAVGIPGLFASASGHSIPAYPFYVSADHPVVPEQHLADPTGTYRLAADAAADQVHGTAKLRGGAGQESSGGTGGSDAITSATANDGTIIATAETVNEAVKLGAGVLTIAAVRSESVTTYHQGDDEPVSTTKLLIEGAKAGDVTFSFGEEGLKAGSQGVPLPADQGLKAINQALAPAGLALEILPSQTIPGGRIANALEVVSVADIPGAGKGTLRLRFGGAMSSVSPGAASSDVTNPAENSGIGVPAASGDNGTGDSAPEAPAPGPSVPGLLPGSSPITALPTDARPGGAWATDSGGSSAPGAQSGAVEAVAPPATTETATNLSNQPPMAIQPLSAGVPGLSGSATGLAVVLLLGGLSAVGLLAGWNRSRT